VFYVIFDFIILLYYFDFHYSIIIDVIILYVCVSVFCDE